MDVNVTFSEPVNCEHCGKAVRIRYHDDERIGLAESNPMPGTEDKNPVHQIHKCATKTNGAGAITYSLSSTLPTGAIFTTPTKGELAS